jgi:hypothetical protein
MAKVVCAHCRNFFFTYSYVHTLFGPFLPLPPPSTPTALTSKQNLFCPFLQIVEE